MSTSSDFTAALEAQTLAGLDDASLAEELSKRGFIVHASDRAHPRIDLAPGQKSGSVRVGVVTDTHLGSKYQQLTYWEHFAKECERAGVDAMIHLGDVVDGSYKMHRGMEYEQFAIGYDAQLTYAMDKWPQVKAKDYGYVPQYLIGGNHDWSFANDTGANLGRDLSRVREDIHSLGGPNATLVLGGVELYLLHPDGGPSYARSYRLQKIIEQFPPDDKPNIMLAGHWHVASHLPGYRNVEAFACPCFQAQTPYLRRKGLAPVIGGLILDLEYSEQGLEDFKTKWVLYRTPMERDY